METCVVKMLALETFEQAVCLFLMFSLKCPYSKMPT